MSRVSPVLGWIAFVACLVTASVGATLLVLTPSAARPEGYSAFVARLDTSTIGLMLLAGLAYAFVGAVIVSRRPRHPIGQMFVAIGLAWAALLLSAGYVEYGLWVLNGRPPGIVWFAWVASWVWAIPAGLAFTLCILLFPTGSLPSARWRPVGWLAVIAIAGTTVGLAFGPGQLANNDFFDNPVGLSGPVGAALTAWNALAIGSYLQVAVVLLACASILLRLRRATGVEREQLKWFVYAATMLSVATFIEATVITMGADRLFQLSLLLTSFGFASLPVATGIAILRHHLYDIDVLISRTFVYGSLVAILAGLYAASIQLFKAIFVGLTGDESDAAIVITTLILATTFTPIKNRLEEIAKRRFKEPEDAAEPQSAQRVPVAATAGASGPAGVAILADTAFLAALERTVERVVRRVAREENAETVNTGEASTGS
jgi:hypothetical protein